MGVILQIVGTIITFAMAMAMEALRCLGIDEGGPHPLAFLHRRAWARRGAARITPRACAQQPRLLEAMGARFARKQAAARPWAG